MTPGPSDVESPWRSAPATALCILVAVVPLAFAAVLYEPYLAIKEALVPAGAATVAALWLLRARKGALSLALTAAWLALGGLALAGGISMLRSSHPAVSWAAGWHLLSYFLLFAVALHQMRRAENRAMLATALMAAGTIEAVYVLLQYSLGDPIFLTGSLPGKWRTFGTLGNPNWAGEFLAVAALTSLGRLVEERKSRWRRAALILMVLALAATLARGAWLGSVLGAAAFLVVRRRWAAAPPGDGPRRRSWPLALAAALGAVLIVVTLIGNQQAMRHLLNLKSARGRIWMSAVTWSMIKDAPWAGHGLGTFGLHFPLYQARAFSQGWAAGFIPNASFTSYAHNDYLQIWAEAGVFALAAFGALVWIVLKRGRALAGDPVALGCWAALISLLVNAAVAFPLHLPTSLMLFAVLLGAVEGASCQRTVSVPLSATPARIGVWLVALALCFTAYRSGYHRLASDAALLRAGVALQSRHWDHAEEAIRAAIHHAPSRIEGHSLLGRLYLERGEHERAIAALDQAMELGSDTEAYEWKATALEKSGHYAAALETLKELAWLRPDLSWPRRRISTLGRAGASHRGGKQ